MHAEQGYSHTELKIVVSVAHWLFNPSDYSTQQHKASLHFHCSLTDETRAPMQVHLERRVG